MMHRGITLADMAKEIHENAKAHGWWEDEREEGEIYALIHSEWSEALEEHRANRPDSWYICTRDDVVGICPNQECVLTADVPCKHRCAKPEGICVELIDGVIRIMDYLCKKGSTDEYTDGTPDWYFEMLDEEGEKWTNEARALKLPSLVNRLHNETCAAWRGLVADDEYESEFLLEAATVAWQWIKGRGLDPMALLIEKHEYNKTRPYKHGKVC